MAVSGDLVKRGPAPPMDAPWKYCRTYQAAPAPPCHQEEGGADQPEVAVGGDLEHGEGTFAKNSRVEVLADFKAYEDEPQDRREPLENPAPELIEIRHPPEEAIGREEAEAGVRNM